MSNDNAQQRSERLHKSQAHIDKAREIARQSRSLREASARLLKEIPTSRPAPFR